MCYISDREKFGFFHEFWHISLNNYSLLEFPQIPKAYISVCFDPNEKTLNVAGGSLCGILTPSTRSGEYSFIHVINKLHFLIVSASIKPYLERFETMTLKITLKIILTLKQNWSYTEIYLKKVTLMIKLIFFFFVVKGHWKYTKTYWKDFSVTHFFCSQNFQIFFGFTLDF